MGVPIIKGSNGLIQKPYEIYFDPRSGEVVRYLYRSAGGPGALLQTYALARNTGWRGRLSVSPTISELEIESPDPVAGQEQVVTDTWQVVGSELSRTVFENRIIGVGLSANDRNYIAWATTNNKKWGERLEAEEYAAWGGNLNVPTSGAAYQLFKEIKNGQDAFAVAQYVLRHTTNCSASSTNNVSDFNVERLYTTAQLLSEVQNGSLWFQPLPTRLRTKILNIPTPTVPADLSPYYLWSWRKLPSTETTTVHNRIEVNTEYVLDLWSTLRYALAS